MGGIFSKPKVPKVGPAPVEEDKAVQEATADMLRRRRMARGMRSTILTNLLEQAKPALRSTFGG